MKKQQIIFKLKLYFLPDVVAAISWQQYGIQDNITPMKLMSSHHMTWPVWCLMLLDGVFNVLFTVDDIRMICLSVYADELRNQGAVPPSLHWLAGLRHQEDKVVWYTRAQVGSSQVVCRLSVPTCHHSTWPIRVCLCGHTTVCLNTASCQQCWSVTHFWIIYYCNITFQFNQLFKVGGWKNCL